MKIRVEFTLNVDQHVWAEEHCLNPNEVRGDVQCHVQELAREALREVGALK